MRLPAALACVLVLACLAPGARADLVRAAARIEVGGEHDSNPARLESLPDAPPAVGASPAGRVAVAADAAGRFGNRTAAGVSAAVAARGFTTDEARDESVVIAQASATGSLALGSRTNVVLAGAYYDAFQSRHEGARDFRSLAPSLRVEQSLGLGRVFAGGSYRWFVFKQEPALDFTGPGAHAGYRVAFGPSDLAASGADWELSLSGSYEGRRFSGLRCLPSESCPPTEGARRRDHFFAGQLELTRVGDALLGGGAAAQWNLSNSFGEGLRRWLVFARAATPLPLSFTLSARVDVVLTRYFDQLSLRSDPVNGALYSIEEENRSTARVELSHPLLGSVDVVARYTYYTSAPEGSSAHYRRQVLLLALTAAWER